MAVAWGDNGTLLQKATSKAAILCNGCEFVYPAFPKGIQTCVRVLLSVELIDYIPESPFGPCCVRRQQFYLKLYLL